MSDTRITSDISSILVAVRDKLVTDGVFTGAFIALNPIQLQNPPDDRYVMITPGTQTLFQPSIAGGGRSYLLIKGKIAVTIWTRLMLDDARFEDSYLTDASLGALEKLKCVINSLTMFEPLDVAGQYLLGEPMRFLEIEVPKKTNLPGWGYCSGWWEVVYTQDLSCAG